MNILVTGVSGLVGNLIARRLVSQQHSVRGMVRDSGRTETLGSLIKLVRADLNQPDTLAAAVKGVDVIVHCAALVGSGRGSDEDYNRINTVGTLSLVNAARAAGVRRFVYMSTSGVYGTNILKGNVNEDTPYGTGNSYTQSKVSAEQVVRTSGVPYVILRPYWITGGGDRFLIPSISRLLLNNSFTYIGNGEQEMSISAVENVSQVAALAAIHPKASNRIYNVADETVKVRDVVTAIARGLGVPAPTTYSSVISVAFRSLVNQSASNPARMTIDLFFPLWRTMTVDATRLRTELDWTPQVDWRESLQQGVLDWKRKNVR